MLLILSIDDLTCACLSSLPLVGWKEYWGVGGCSGAVSMSGNAEVLHGNAGSAAGSKTGDTIRGDITGPLDVDTAGGADQPGLGGLVGGWASLTRSSPNESDLLSDSENWWLLNGTRSGCASIISFAGN